MNDPQSATRFRSLATRRFLDEQLSAGSPRPRGCPVARVPFLLNGVRVYARPRPEETKIEAVLRSVSRRLGGYVKEVWSPVTGRRHYRLLLTDRRGKVLDHNVRVEVL